jgi:hypothetical protein
MAPGEEESQIFELDVLARPEILKALAARATVRIDLPRDRKIAEAYDVQDAPTILLFSEDGKETWRGTRPHFQTLLDMIGEDLK